LLIRLLANFTLQFLDLAFGLHLLVVNQRSDAIFHFTSDLFGLALGPLSCLGALLFGFAAQLPGFALGLHLLVADDFASKVLELAADFLCSAFALLGLVAHVKAPQIGMRGSMAALRFGTRVEQSVCQHPLSEARARLLPSW
jgi:hypothetical protein